MYDEYNDFQDDSDTEDDDDENERPFTSTPQSMPFKFINGKDGMGKKALKNSEKIKNLIHNLFKIFIPVFSFICSYL